MTRTLPWTLLLVAFFPPALGRGAAKTLHRISCPLATVEAMVFLPWTTVLSVQNHQENQRLSETLAAFQTLQTAIQGATQSNAFLQELPQNIGNAIRRGGQLDPYLIEQYPQHVAQLSNLSRSPAIEIFMERAKGLGPFEKYRRETEQLPTLIRIFLTNTSALWRNIDSETSRHLQDNQGYFVDPEADVLLNESFSFFTQTDIKTFPNKLSYPWVGVGAMGIAWISTLATCFFTAPKKLKTPLEESSPSSEESHISLSES